eukprot:4882479-Alexandrium_andersonii.AAC.1
MSSYGALQHVLALGRRPGRKQQHGAPQPGVAPRARTLATRGSTSHPHRVVAVVVAVVAVVTFVIFVDVVRVGVGDGVSVAVVVDVVVA